MCIFSHPLSATLFFFIAVSIFYFHYIVNLSLHTPISRAYVYLPAYIAKWKNNIFECLQSVWWEKKVTANRACLKKILFYYNDKCNYKRTYDISMQSRRHLTHSLWIDKTIKFFFIKLKKKKRKTLIKSSC